MKHMKVAVLFSGGKDSTYTLWIALQQYEEVKLISVLSAEESFLYHYQKEHIIHGLEEAIGLPITIVTVKNEIKELYQLEEAVKKLQVEAILIGGLLSEYQRVKFNEVARRCGIPCFAPLWRKDHILLLQDIEKHFEVIFSTVASMGLSDKDLGRKLDQKMLDRLIKLHEKDGLSIGGEGGEYETLVLDAPFYKRRLVIDEMKKEWNEAKLFGYCRIEKVYTEEKNS